MKKIIKIIWVAFAILISVMLVSCSSVRVGTSIGFSVHGGPGGPQVTPHMNVGVYGGGRL